MNTLTLVKNTSTIITEVKPSVFEQTNRHPNKTTDKYSVVATKDLIALFEKSGFSYTIGKKKNVKITSPNYGFERHSVDFLHPDLKFGDLYLNIKAKPRITLVNAFDGTTRLDLKAGIFEMICSNGMYVGKLFQQYNHKHINLTTTDIEDMLHRWIAMYKNEITPMIGEMRNFKLKPEQELELAQAIMAQRMKGINYIDIDYSKVLKIHRPEEADANLYNVMNRIQENIGLNFRKVVDAPKYTFETVAKDGITKEIKERKLVHLRDMKRVHDLNSLIFDEAARLYLPQYSEKKAA